MGQTQSRLARSIHFPDRLREALRLRNMSTKVLASKVGVAQSTVQRWLEGSAEPRLAGLVELSRVLGVSPGFLLGVTDIPLA